MYELDVVLTDVALAVECGLLGSLLLRSRAPRAACAQWSAAFLFNVGAAALIGAAVHAVFPDHSAGLAAVLWSLTLIAIGAAALCAWVIGAELATPPAVAIWVRRAASAVFVAYVLIVATGAREFVVAILMYVPAMLFLMVAAILHSVRRTSRNAPLGVAGILLTFVAAWAQIARIGLHARYFDHNALYHAIQGLGLFLLFVWLRRATGPVRAATPGG